MIIRENSALIINSQITVAKLLNVESGAVTVYELDRHVPTAKMSRRVIQCIGYYPCDNRRVSIGTKLLHARMIQGDTQYQVVEAMDCNASNL